jgi:hypothetical protein
VAISFSTEDLLRPRYDFTKGGVPGHQFHGNQWTSDGLAAAALKLHKGSSIVAMRDDPQRFIKGHSEIASGHALLAAKAYQEGHTELAKAHLAAAQTHALAASFHTFRDASKGGNFVPTGGNGYQASMAAASLDPASENYGKWENAPKAWPQSNEPSAQAALQQMSNGVATQQRWGQTPKW